MTDDIVTRLANLADKFKDGELEMLYSDYETVCDAWREIERLRALLSRWQNCEMVVDGLCGWDSEETMCQSCKEPF
jgi:hypothetical protein